MFKDQRTPTHIEELLPKSQAPPKKKSEQNPRKDVPIKINQAIYEGPAKMSDEEAFLKLDKIP